MLSTAERSERMRSMFQSGLAIQHAGEEMEACRAIKTPLFPHQRVGLAWMFKHENVVSGGMRGGILADDMGLGKSLTVLALILTNHHDQKPLCKPELGFTRSSFSATQKRTRRAGVSQPRPTAEQLGVGKKLVVNKKKPIGSLFDNLKKKLDDSDSESEKENKPFSFLDAGATKKKSGRGRHEDDSDDDDDSFINDDSSDAGTWTESEEDEFSKMGGKKNFFTSSKTAFKQEENPIDLENLKDLDEADSELSQEELMQSMIPTSLDDSDMEPNQNLNVDGPNDLSESDEEFHFQSTNKRKAINSSSDEDSKADDAKGKTLKKARRDYDDSYDELPSPDARAEEDPQEGPSHRYNDDTEEVRGEPSKNRNTQVVINSRVNVETGLKLIIPPRQPAERGKRRRATLLVCPTSLLSHWTEQLDTHLDKGVDIRFKIHHGQTKALTGADLETQDIVLTTYGTLAAEFGAATHSPLLRAKWLRVVFDEGHFIKNHRTKTCKAALNLDCERRWIVTGTPIQNNLMEFWSLINWLGFGAYAGKGQMRHYKDQIARPCKAGDPQGFERLQVLIDSVCLRRTKSDKKLDGSPIVELPSKTLIMREVEFTEDENIIYRHVHKNAQEVVARYQKRGEGAQ